MGNNESVTSPTVPSPDRSAEQPVRASELVRLPDHRFDGPGWERAQLVQVRMVDQGGRQVPAMAAEGDPVRLVTRTPEQPFDPVRHVVLGTVGEGTIVLDLLGDAELGLPVRDLLPQLSNVERDIANAAVALHAWHQQRHCRQCGGPTVPTSGGAPQLCQECGALDFPRTDPAIIVAITDEQDRLLLGHQGSWDNNRYSLLAGFVEAGESLEQAVFREVFEEAGVRLDRVSYVTSQPWPFPRSLMLGFTATARSQDVEVDGEEITHAAFYTREEVNRAVADCRMSLPGAPSLGHELIHRWLAGRLPATS